MATAADLFSDIMREGPDIEPGAAFDLKRHRRWRVLDHIEHIHCDTTRFSFHFLSRARQFI